jgi:hypothetical protein
MEENMNPYHWVAFDNDSDVATEMNSHRQSTGEISISGFRKIDNNDALKNFRASLIANGYAPNSRICIYLEQLTSYYNPESACWLRSDMVIKELGVDPVDCVDGMSQKWLREMFG